MSDARRKVWVLLLALYGMRMSSSSGERRTRCIGGSVVTG
jgi:hypothetical protein